MGADVIVLALSSITSGTYFASLGVGGCCLPPRSQGIVELTLSLDCLAHPVSIPGDCATSIHLEGLLRGRVSRWLSLLEQWVFRGGKGHLCPQFRQQVSSQQRYWAFRDV